MMKREAGAQKVSKIIMCMKFWVILLFLFVRAAGGVSRLKRYETDGVTRSCAGLPDKLDFDHKLTLTSTTNSGAGGAAENEESNNKNTGDFWTYLPSEATLALDLSAIIYLDDAACTHENQTVSHFRIDLISIHTPKGMIEELQKKYCSFKK